MKKLIAMMLIVSFVTLLIPNPALADNEPLTDKEKIKLATKITKLQIKNNKLEDRIVIERSASDKVIEGLNSRLKLEMEESETYQELYEITEKQLKAEKVKKWLFLIGGAVVGYGLGQVF